MSSLVVVRYFIAAAQISEANNFKSQSFANIKPLETVTEIESETCRTGLKPRCE